MQCTLQREHSDSQAVKIQESVDPSTFWVIPDQEEPPGSKIDSLLTQLLSNSKEKCFDPQKGQMVAVMCLERLIWQRGIVEQIFHAGRDNKYLVFLVDYGLHKKVHFACIRELPKDKIFQKDHYAAQFKLYGILPCEKGIFRDNFKLIPFISETWQPAASAFLIQKIQAATEVYMSCLQAVDVCGGNIIFGDLHFVINGQCVSITKELCLNNFAIYDANNFEVKHGLVQDVGNPQDVSLQDVCRLEDVSLEDAYRPQQENSQMSMQLHDHGCSFDTGDLQNVAPLSAYKTKDTTVVKDQTGLASMESCKEKKTSTCEPILIPGGMNLNNVISNRKSPTKSTAKGYTRGFKKQYWQKPDVVHVTNRGQTVVSHNRTQGSTGHQDLPTSSSKSTYLESLPVNNSKTKETPKPSSYNMQISQSNISMHEISNCAQVDQKVITTSSQGIAQKSSQQPTVQHLTGRGRRLSELMKQHNASVKLIESMASGTSSTDQFSDVDTEQGGTDREVVLNSLSNSSTCSTPKHDPLETEGSPQGLFHQIKTALGKTENSSKPTKNSQNYKDEPKTSSPTVNNEFSGLITVETQSNVKHFKSIEGFIANRVLVHGCDSNTGREVVTLAEANFHEVVHMGFEKLKVKTPFRIQRVVWPAILQGDNVMVVHSRCSGKTVGYVAPLISCVLNKENYSQFLGGNGPFAIIVCSSAPACESVLKKFDQLADWDKYIKVSVAFGRSDEEINWVNLTNGCDILISTPRCLLRVLSMSSVTNMKRLCHLVLDEADKLMDKFSMEVGEILHQCAQAKRRRESRGVHHDVQIVTAAEKWCPRLNALLQPLAPTPLICIGAHMEAAIYARLQPSLEILNVTEKRARLLEIVADKMGTFKIVIVCQCAAEVDEVYTLLEPVTSILMRANENMTNIELVDLIPSWKAANIYGMYPVLICSDAVLPEMNINDATCLIHFNLPLKKTHFDIRFSCLMNNHPNPYVPAQANYQKSAVHIFVGDQNCQQFPVVIEFMKRLGATILPALEEAAREELLKKETRKEKAPLCIYIKTFGECWNKSTCPQRHAVIESDKPVDIPELGQVKLKVLCVVNATQFSARLLEHTDSQGVVHSFRNKYLKIFRPLNSHFSIEENKLPHGHPKLGDICAYENKMQVLSRVEVTAIKSYDTLNKPNHIEVLHIDTGGKELCESFELLSLPQNLREIPPLAVNVFMCRLLPPDLDSNWSNSSRWKMKTWLQDTEESEEGGPFIIGKIKLSLGNSLWLDPLQGRQCISRYEGKNGLILKDFRQLMLRENLAVDNPHHLLKLYDICKQSGISIPDYSPALVINRVFDNSPKLPNPQWAHLPDDDMCEVLFNSALHPGQFFVCLKKFLTNLNRLKNEIQKFVVERKDVENNLTIQTGVLCLGRFPDDGLWYRARVSSVTDNGQVELFFVDHGDSAVVTADADIVAIHAKHITVLPFQAIECSLVGIEPLDAGTWGEKATDELYDFTVDLESDYRKTMFAKVCSKGKADSTGGTKYSILLACLDDNKSDVNVVNKALLTMGLVQINHTDYGCIEDLTLDQLNINANSIEKQDDMGNSENHNDANDTIADEYADNDDSDANPVLSNFSEVITNESGSVNSNANDDATFTNSELMSLIPPEQDRLADETCAGFDFELDNVHQFIMDLLAKKEDKPPTLPQVSNELADHPQLPAVCQNAASSVIHVSPTYDAGSKIPYVVWYQDEISVTISIEVANVKDKNYDLKINNTSLIFNCVVQDDVYFVDLQLYGSICCDKSEDSSTGRRICIKLKKLIPGNWPRLQKIKGNYSWLKYNADHENPESSFVKTNLFERSPKESVEGSISRKSNCVLDVQAFDSDEESVDDNYIEEDRPFVLKDFYDPLN